jgi:outer membrane protein assembly factor BamB
MRTLCWLLAGVLAATAAVTADDWPEFRGAGRHGIWKETGIVDTLPAGALKVVWRAPVNTGYSGPAVAGGRVFLTDFIRAAGSRGTERVLGFDEATGKLLWKQEWDVNYGGMGFENGPHATPTVDGDRVYVVGANGMLMALNTRSGEIIWKKDYVKDYAAELGLFGMSSAPVVDGNRLIAFVGGAPDAKVVAFDKVTGKEIWRAMTMTSPIGNSTPLIIEAGGTRQLIVWDTIGVTALNPATGATLWAQPAAVPNEMNIAMAHGGSRLIVSSFMEGPVMFELSTGKPGAKTVWKGESASEVLTDKLHATVSMPIIDGDYVYGICSYGQLRALDARTGERLWETQAATGERARWASAQMVKHGDRVFITNERGELVLARLTPKAYEELGRVQLLKPTSNPRTRRKLGVVNWSSPAYANKRIYARNDEELISVSLAQSDYR